MSIVCPILLAAATLTSAGGPGTAHTRVSSAPAPLMTLSDAVYAAARRESLSLNQHQAPGSARPLRQNSRRSPARYSAMTRATAIVAGAVMGSLAGLVGGALVDMAASNGECVTGMRVGMPVGAVLGAVVTARYVR
jgi:hypothetical protein